MALIDTGLGWSADENYLKQYSGLLGKISAMGGAAWEGQPIPHTENTDTDVRNNGFCSATYNNSPNNGFFCGEITSPAAEVFVCRDASIDPPRWLAISATQNAKVRYYWTYSSGRTATLDTQDSTTGLWYSYLGQFDYNLTYYMPAYNSVADACAALSQSTDFYKLNNGYTVACFLKLKVSDTLTSTGIFSISTNPDYTTLSGDGSSSLPGQFLGRYIYNGLLFYMRYIDPIANGTVSDNVMPYADITNMGTIGIGSALFAQIARMASILITDPGINPYPAEPSEPGGGDSEPDTETNIDFPVPPSIGAISSGFVTLFLPTLSQINNLANYLWSVSFDVDQVKKMFLSPMDAILGLYILPVSPAVSGNKVVSVAGVPISDFNWSYTTQEYISLTCGSITIPKATGSYLDYSPMTKLQIWLPFIGFRDIDADDCMGKTLTLQYNISVLSGACVAMLKCGDTLLYSWAGNCSMQIPITGADYRTVIGNSLAVAATIAGLAVGSPTTATAIAGVASIGQNALNAKPLISRSGSVSGDAGFLAKQIPYIVRSNPVMCNPGAQNKYIGYPSFVTISLAEINGYNEIYSIHLEGVPGTDAELSEIENLLKSGVIF